jgi:hypothetical protein
MAMFNMIRTPIMLDHLATGLLFCLALSATSAWSAGPAADYKLDPEYTGTSPDGATTIEQYAKTVPDGSRTWQFWAHRSDNAVLLTPEQPDYPAGFSFTKDSQWLVRMQKTGSGESSLYLYRLRPEGFAAATTKPLSDMAWAYFYSLPVSRRITKPDFHIEAGLLKGTDDNYRWMGVDWPDSRYLVISLSGEVSSRGMRGRIASVQGWRCRYELETGSFDVPPDFLEHNAKAIAPDSR